MAFVAPKLLTFTLNLCKGRLQPSAISISQRTYSLSMVSWLYVFVTLLTSPWLYKVNLSLGQWSLGPMLIAIDLPHLKLSV